MIFTTLYLLCLFLIVGSSNATFQEGNKKNDFQTLQNTNKITESYRNLQVSTPQQVNQSIRISFNVMNQEQNSDIVNSFTAARNYIQQITKIKPEQDPIQIQRIQCPEVFTSFYPGNNNFVQITNSDLQIYVLDNPDSTLKFPYVCLSNSVNGRPMVGVIYQNFNDDILQIMVLSKDNFKRFKDLSGVPYQESLYLADTDQILGGGRSVILSFPHILQEVRNHFDCSTLEGALLENEVQGDDQWRYLDKGVFFNEISTISIKRGIGDVLFQKPIFSRITTSLLQDSNWYAEIDQQQTDHLIWGRRKGCSFISQQKKLYTGNLSQEFCSTLNEQGVQVNQFGKGVCQTDAASNTLSYYQYVNSADRCDFTQGQRMFLQLSSNVRTFSCYKATCKLSTDQGSAQLWQILLENPLQIGTFYTCKNPNDLIAVGNTNLVCPSDFISFCSTYSLFCQDGCNQRGLCISGKCFCNDKYFGPTCQCDASISKYFTPSTWTGNNPLIACVSTCDPAYKLQQSQNICVKNLCDVNDASWINCQNCNTDQKDKCLVCKQGFVLVNGLCEKCGVKSCALCAKNIKYQCEMCKQPTSLLDSNRCISECPYSYYSKLQADNSRICIKCHTDCKNCTGPSEKECTICSNSDYSVFAYPLVSTPSGECKKCPSDYFYVEYKVGQSQFCKQCDQSCQRCKGPLGTDCIQCKLDSTTNSQQKFIDQITKKCVNCPSSYFGDSVDYQCKKCDNACKECVGLTDKDCLSCSNANFFIQQLDNSCQLCPDLGYYKENSICKKCHPLCKTCNGPYASNCLTCTNGATSSTCVQCQSGFYFDTNAQRCIACNDSCDECIGGSEKDCTKCAYSLYLRQNIQNQSLCGTCDSTKSEYTNSQYNKCMSCHSSCLTCLGSLPNQCITCKQPQFFKDSNFNLICRQCTQAQYINKDSVCLNCHPTCLSCKGPTELDCITCRNPVNSILLNGSCGLCAQTQYIDAYNYCKPCNNNCLGCTSETMCTSCQPNSIYKLLNYDGTCVQDCQSGSYQDKDKQMCIQCDPTCQECTGSKINECTSCYDNGALKQDRTCEYCQSGYFLKEDVNACALCNSACETCIEKSDQCILCSQGYFKNSYGKCDLVCKQNEIKVEVDPLTSQIVRRCDKCDLSCQSCIGTSQFQCLACKEEYFRVEDTNECVVACPDLGYFQEGSQCLKCQQNCIRCLNIDTCQECSSNYSLFNSQICMQTCPDSMYSNNKKCANCQITCKTCSQYDKCITCNSGYYLSLAKNTCEINCAVAEYKDTTLFQCSPCNQYCLQCNGPPNFACVNCQSNKNKRLDNTCGDCDSGQYSDKGVCYICSSSCLECFGSGTDQCRTCKDGYYLSGSKCFQCTTLNCQTCQADRGTNICKSCIATYFLNDDAKCYLTCPSLYYSDSTSRTCKKCGQNCKQCSERRGCTDCLQQSQYKVRNSFVCVDKCPLDQYVSDEVKKECVKKDCQIANCEQCDYINQICKKCLDGYNIANQSQLCLKCAADEYFYYQFERCVKINEYCDPQCLTCQGPTSLDCLECKMQYKQESQGKFYCVSNCYANYYPDSTTKTCKPCFKQANSNQCFTKCPDKTFASNQNCIDCFQSCITCYGSSQTNCLACIDGLYLWQDGSCQKFCPSNQCPIQGKCSACSNPNNPDSSDDSSDQQTYLAISSFECCDNCDKEENFAQKIGNAEKVSSIIQISASIINLAFLNVDAFTQLQSSQLIGNLVFGQNNGKLGMGEFQLKHSFLSNFINWIPNTFLDLSQTSTPSTSISLIRNLEQANNSNEVKISLYSTEIAEKLKINNLNKYFYQNCFFLLIILSTLLFTYISTKFLEFNSVQRFVRWNGAICYQLIFSNFTYVSIFHAFQVDTPGQSRDDFDLFLASFILIYQIGFLTFQIIRINVKPSIIDQQDEEEIITEEEKYESNSISILKINIKQSSAWTRNYWIFYEIRKITNSLLIIITKGHQGAVWTLMFFNLVFLIYVIFKKPFTVPLQQRLSVWNEVMMSLIYASFGFSISFSSKKGGLTFAYITSILVLSNMIVNILFSIYSFYRKFYPDQKDMISQLIKEESNKSSVPKKETELINFDGQLSSISYIENNQDKSYSSNNNNNNNKKLFRSAVSINHYTVRNQNFLND